MPKKSGSPNRTIQFKPLLGEFAEDKDVAAGIRKSQISPIVGQGGKVVLDFTGVGLVTQSFIHALISSVLRTNGEKALSLITFKGCSQSVRGIIETVVQYSLDTGDTDNEKEKKPRKLVSKKKAKKSG